MGKLERLGFSPEDLRAMYLFGRMSMKKISQKVGISRIAVYQNLKKIGIGLRDRKPVTRKCWVCEKEIVMQPSRAHRSKKVFCSNEHYREYLRKKGSYLKKPAPTPESQ